MISPIEKLESKWHITSRILNFINGISKERSLNIISVPYSNTFMFLDVILSMTSQQKKVLYITNENEKDIQILKYIKRNTDFRSYSYIRDKNSHFENSYLIICSHENAYGLDEKFNLIIYDDLSSFSNYSKKQIEDLLNHVKYDRLISYSIEPIFNNGNILEIPTKKINMPMTEPRIITTRIDISKEIPYVAYEYLNWFMKSNRKVIIYVPDSYRADKVYDYLYGLKGSIRKYIWRYTLEEDKKFQSLLKSREQTGIIVTEYIEDLNWNITGLDIMVYFADDKSYDYKKLVYICGKVGMNDSFSNGEVIFLANSNTEDMEKAKAITRNFNKMAWEKGLLNI